MWQAVRVVHLLAMAFFVGGQLLLAVAVPVLRRTGDQAVVGGVVRRFGVGALAALALLAASGAAMARHYGRWSEPRLQIKLALVVAILGLIVAHARHPRAWALDLMLVASSVAVVALGVSIAH